ncbi:hypothetical protein KEM55_008637, partial [Ascosphaera atra]
LVLRLTAQAGPVGSGYEYMLTYGPIRSPARLRPRLRQPPNINSEASSPHLGKGTSNREQAHSYPRSHYPRMYDRITMQQHLANILNTPRRDETDHGEQNVVTLENDSQGRTGTPIAGEEEQPRDHSADDPSGGENGTSSQGMEEEDFLHKDEEEDAAAIAAAKKAQLKALQQQIEALEVGKQLQQAQCRLHVFQQGAVDRHHLPYAQDIGELTRLKLPEVKAEKVGKVQS